MPSPNRWSKESRSRRDECHPDLQRLADEVLRHWDCAITCGHRGQAEQEKAFRTGNSRSRWPDGKHNKIPSLAIDMVPLVHGEQNWSTKVCRVFGGFVMGVAASLGISIRYGGDWDGDRDPNDQTLNDLVHFELL